MPLFKVGVWRRSGASLAPALLDQVIGNPSNGTTVITMVLPLGAPNNGDVLALLSGGSAALTKTISTVVQTGVTWTKKVTSAVSGGDHEAWVGVVGAGASATCTVTMSGATDSGIGLNLSRWSNINTTTPVDASGTSGNNGTSASPTTASVTPGSHNYIVLLGVSRKVGTLNSGPTNSFTALTDAGGAHSAYLIVTANSGAYSTSWTYSSSTAWDTVIMTLIGSN